MGTSFHDNNRDNRPARNQGQRQNFEDFNKKVDTYFGDIVLLLNPDANVDNIKTAINQIEKMVKDIKDSKGKDKMTAHQVRNIYSLIRETKDSKKLNLIRPRLAYIAARQKDEQGKIISKVIDRLIEKVTEEKAEEKMLKKRDLLIYVMECIVAYHKFHIKE